MPTSDENTESALLMLGAVRRRLDNQRASIERLETKATLILGFIAAAVPLYVVADAQVALRIAALLFYGVAALIALVAVLPTKVRDSPPPRKTNNRVLDRELPPLEVARALTSHGIKAFETNGAIQAKKAGQLWYSLACFLFAASLSVLSILF